MSRPFIPVPNTASVELLYQLPVTVAENIFHVRKATPYSAADLVALRTLVDSWDNVSWASRRITTVTLFRIICKALDSLGSPLEDYTLPTPRAGGTVATPVPSNVTWAVKKATGLTGRSFRGRWYMVGLGGANYDMATQQVTVATANGIISALNTLRTNLAAAGHTLGVVSYRTAGDWRAEGLFTPITAFVYTDLVIDSQRRRLPGRGI